MNEGRFPKIYLQMIIRNINSNNNIEKYNWISQLNEVFFRVINENVPWNDFVAFFSMLDIEAICARLEQAL